MDLKQLLQLLETELSLEWSTHKDANGDIDDDLSNLKVPSERD
ncbi:hypothetical protein [Myxosarcina sp. GI1(2024)]